MNVVDSTQQAPSVAEQIAQVESVSALRHGVIDTMPFALSVVPFGLAIGNASAVAGLSIWQAMFGGVSLLAGSAQLAAIQVHSSGGGILLTAAVVALINLRFVFYGAGVASWFSEFSLRRRLVLAFPIVDQSFILCQGRFETEPDPNWRQSYYVAATTTLVFAFLSTQLIAFYGGAGIPEAAGLQLAAPLAFVGMLARSIADSSALTAAVVASIVTVAGSVIVGALALPAGVVVGVLVAMGVSR